MRRLFYAAVLLATTSASHCHDPMDLLRELKFTALTPPSNLYSPGAVLSYEEVEGEEPTQFQLTCGPRAALGREYAPTVSRTAAHSFNSRTARQFTLTGDMLGEVKGMAGGRGVQSITGHLTNARILSLTDADVLEYLPHRSPECQRAIQARLDQGHKVTMICAALVADFEWQVEWEDSINFNKKARLVEMQKVAASLGGGQQRVGLKTIESRGLALGIRTDPFLLALTVPEMSTRGSASQIDRETAQQPVRARAKTGDDAVIVLPYGSYAQPTLEPDED